MFEAARRRRDQGAVDRVHQPGAVDARPGDGARGARARRVRRGAGGVRTTATCAFADLLLPATTWGEKEGTVTNSERRITRVRAALAPPGEARADWAIAADFARRLERACGRARRRCSRTRRRRASLQRARATTRGRDLDITGLTHAMLDAHGPQQWPCREAMRRARARLYADGRFATADGRARFAAVAVRARRRARDARYPFASTPAACATSGTA